MNAWCRPEAVDGSPAGCRSRATGSRKLDLWRLTLVVPGDPLRERPRPRGPAVGGTSPTPKSPSGDPPRLRSILQLLRNCEGPASGAKLDCPQPTTVIIEGEGSGPVRLS